MVMKFLADNEIITVAMNLEDEGYRFYDEVARISRHKDSKDIFNKLKTDEEEHYKTFKGFLDALPQTDSRDYFDIKEEIAAYLNSLIETDIFKNIDKGSIKKMDEVQALEIGVKAERDSILFYTQARESSINQKAKDILVKIIEIEKGHLITLTNRLRMARRLF